MCQYWSWVTFKYVTPLLVLSVSFADSIISSGTCQSVITLMNLFRANPALMVPTALGLWVELSLNDTVSSLILAAAMASPASFQLSALKPSWIRSGHGRNKSHYHTQDSFTSVAVCRCFAKIPWIPHEASTDTSWIVCGIAKKNLRIRSVERHLMPCFHN